MLVKFFVLLLIYELLMKIPYGLSHTGSFYFPSVVRSGSHYYMIWTLNALVFGFAILLIHKKKIAKTNPVVLQSNYFFLDVMMFVLPLLSFFFLVKEMNLTELASGKKELTSIASYFYLKGSFFALVSASYFLVRVNITTKRLTFKKIMLRLCFWGCCVVAALTAFIFSQRAVILVLMLQMYIINFAFHRTVSISSLLYIFIGFLFVIFVSMTRAGIQEDILISLYNKIMQTRFFIDTFRQVEVMESGIDYNVFNFVVSTFYQDLSDNKVLGRLLGSNVFNMGESGVTPGLIGELYLSFPLLIAFFWATFIFWFACFMEYNLYNMRRFQLYRYIFQTTVISNFVIALNSSLGAAMWQILVNTVIFLTLLLGNWIFVFLFTFALATSSGREISR